METRLPRRRFTVDEYYRLADAGIFGHNERVELIDGDIVETPPPSPQHAACNTRLSYQLHHHVGGQAIVSVRHPVRLSSYSEPEPDLALLRYRSDFYEAAHPGPSDVLLIAEVADTSLDYDRDIKLPLYAVAAIQEVWIANLKAGTVEVYREPARDRYSQTMVLHPGDVLTPRAFPDISILVKAILG